MVIEKKNATNEAAFNECEWLLQQQHAELDAQEESVAETSFVTGDGAIIKKKQKAVAEEKEMPVEQQQQPV